MRTRPARTSSARLAAAVIAAAAVALVASASTGANAATSGIRYDELTSVLSSPAPPQPSGFSDRFQAAINAMRPSHHGFFSGIMNAAQQMQAMTKTGMPSTHYYLGQWTRSDDPVKQTATIYRPDRHQIIHLDLAKKTYTIEDMGSQTPSTPEPSAPNPQTSEAPPQPGSGKLDISDTAKTLGAATVNDQQTTGYSQDFKMVSSQSTGSCHDGTLESSMTEYLSSYTQNTGASMATLFQNPSPSMMATRGGCQPKITYHHSGSISVPTGRLAIWTLIVFKGNGAQETQQGQPGGSFSSLTERGNVQTLGPGDAALFDVPAGFTKGS